MDRHHRMSLRPLSAVACSLGVLVALSGCGTKSNAAHAPNPPADTAPAVAPPPATTAVPSGGAIPTKASPVGGARGCSLVTEADVSTTLGDDPGAGLESIYDGGSTCRYNLKSGFLNVEATNSSNKGSWEDGRNGASHHDSSVTFAIVNGVGDEAFTTLTQSQALISFYKGHGDVNVIYTGASPTVAAVTTLAKIAAARI